MVGGISQIPSSIPFSHFTTPADWPLGRTLGSGSGPCLSGASWSALLRLASDTSNVASLDVNGFGHFGLHHNGCAFQDAIGESSAAGPNLGNTENRLSTKG